MLARADSAGATHGFIDGLRARGILFSVGFDLTGPVRDAVLALPSEAWVSARDADRNVREGAEVAELVGFNLARKTNVRLDRNWPWAAALAAAFKRLRAAMPA